MPNTNFQCQALLKNASFVKSGIEKCQLATVVGTADDDVSRRGPQRYTDLYGEDRERPQRYIECSSSAWIA